MIAYEFEIKCPICGNQHQYSLENGADSTIMGNYLINKSGLDKHNTQKLTWLFTCPVKNEDFQVTFVIDEDSQIKSVE
jgi:hypothetical protein